MERRKMERRRGQRGGEAEGDEDLGRSQEQRCPCLLVRGRANSNPVPSRFHAPSCPRRLFTLPVLQQKCAGLSRALSPGYPGASYQLATDCHGLSSCHFANGPFSPGSLAWHWQRHPRHFHFAQTSPRTKSLWLWPAA